MVGRRLRLDRRMTVVLRRAVTAAVICSAAVLLFLSTGALRPRGPLEILSGFLLAAVAGAMAWWRATLAMRMACHPWPGPTWARRMLVTAPLLLGVDAAVRLLGLHELEIAFQLAAVTVVVGLLGLARPALVRDRACTLDAMTVAAVLGVLTWVLLDNPVQETVSPGRSQLLGCAAMVFLLFGTAMRLLLLPAPRPAVVKPFVACLGVLLAEDLFRTWGAMADFHAPTSDAGLSLLAAMLLVVALVDPDLADLCVPSPVASTVRARRMLLVGVGSLPPLLLVAQAALHWTVDVPSVLVAWGVLLALTGARISHLVTVIADERSRHQADVRFHAAFDSAMVGMALVGDLGAEQCRLMEVNRRLCDMLGRREEDLLGMPATTLVTPDSYADLCAALDAVRETERVPLVGDRQLIAAQGRQVWGRLGLAAAAVGCESYAVLQVEDVSDGRRAQQRLHYLATHDPLTGLANRVLLADRLDHALSRRSRHGDIAVLAMDLDRFKIVNDTLGHAAGDHLLRVVSQRLSATLRPEDTVARIGGDEFVVLLEDLDDPAEATAVAERIAVALSEPVQLSAAEATVAVSVGIALAGTGDTSQSLLRNADMAMYQAKENGRSRCERYDERMHDLLEQRMRTEQWLRDCVEGRQLQMAMQPVVDLRRGGIVGYEALVRCHHPDRGLLPPSEFLRVAEDSGLIVPIGEWVLRAALAEAGRWKRRGGQRAPHVGVNVSARQLLAPDFFQQVTGALDDSRVPATRLILEITEGALLETLDTVAGPLRRLRDIGVRVALDDFGTGYSSLTGLRQLPLDTLKIDPSFVAGMQEEKADAGVVQAMIAFAHALGLRTIAEGVETPGQQAALREYGCDFGQGFLLGEPLVVRAGRGSVAGGQGRANGRVSPFAGMTGRPGSEAAPGTRGVTPGGRPVGLPEVAGHAPLGL